ncbi:hypothetical protein OIU77_027908 [Salix suchowensis]|uniref:Uncharacterized protein n=1 Tax=Salix suchowensis TaxID=1278906 RepID=A0ABQ9BRE5_9ROSI|nr:hypothetical protein OIU77_027908 [Salix suchowensis]
MSACKGRHGKKNIYIPLKILEKIPRGSPRWSTSCSKVASHLGTSKEFDSLERSTPAPWPQTSIRNQQIHGWCSLRISGMKVPHQLREK